MHNNIATISCSLTYDAYGKRKKKKISKKLIFPLDSEKMALNKHQEHIS